MHMVSMCRSCRPVNGQRRRRELGLVQGQIALCLDWYQVLRRKVRDAGLEQRVRSPGHRDDVSDALHGTDIFVPASRREAFPAAVLQACASGVPVIATYVGGTAGIIRTAKTGCCSMPGTPTPAQR
jgi:glycosyltransferase involved in cell wall biosynthesis